MRNDAVSPAFILPATEARREAVQPSGLPPSATTPAPRLERRRGANLDDYS